MPDGTEFDPKSACIDLAEIPFIPVRNLFTSELGMIPGGFSSMVQRYSTGMRRKAIENLTLFVSFTRREASVCGKDIPLNTRATIALILLAKRAKANLPACDYQSAATDLPALVKELREAVSKMDTSNSFWLSSLDPEHIDAGDLSKGVSDLRAAFRNLGGDHAQLSFALPKGRFQLDLSPDQIVFVE
jgi:hypothetical protein